MVIQGADPGLLKRGPRSQVSKQKKLKVYIVVQKGGSGPPGHPHVITISERVVIFHFLNNELTLI